MAVPLRVDLTPDRADAQPGEALALQVSVRNTSDVVEHYGIDLLGLPQNTGARVEPDVIKLRPGETGAASVRLTLGTDPPAMAGIYTVGVLARSKYRAELSRCEELTLNVAVVQQIGLQVAPEVATGKRSAKYQVQVVNSGNVPVRLLLAATDPERRAKSRFNPPLVGLQAGEAETVALAIRAPVPWSRETQRALKIEAGGDGAYGAAAATFLQRPRFASKLARVGGAVAALGVIAGAILGSALIARAVTAPEPTPSETVAQAPTTPGGGEGKPASAAGGPSSPGASSPGGAPSGSGSSAPPVAPGAGLKEVDLTRGGPGLLPSDAFRGDGLVLSGNPDQGGDAACVNATALAVRGTADKATQFLASALPDKAETCNASPIQIRFLAKASKVELVYVGAGDRKIEVNFKDYNRTTVTGTSVTDDGSHGGIDFIVVSGVANTGPPVGPAVKAVKFIPLSG
jgi:hypothetical protein